MCGWRQHDGEFGHTTGTAEAGTGVQRSCVPPRSMQVCPVTCLGWAGPAGPAARRNCQSVDLSQSESQSQQFDRQGRRIRVTVHCNVSNLTFRVHRSSQPGKALHRKRHGVVGGRRLAAERSWYARTPEQRQTPAAVRASANASEHERANELDSKDDRLRIAYRRFVPCVPPFALPRAHAGVHARSHSPRPRAQRASVVRRQRGWLARWDLRQGLQGRESRGSSILTVHGSRRPQD